MLQIAIDNFVRDYDYKPSADEVNSIVIPNNFQNKLTNPYTESTIAVTTGTITDLQTLGTILYDQTTGKNQYYTQLCALVIINIGPQCWGPILPLNCQSYCGQNNRRRCISKHSWSRVAQIITSTTIIVYIIYVRLNQSNSKVLIWVSRQIHYTRFCSSCR